MDTYNGSLNVIGELAPEDHLLLIIAIIAFLALLIGIPLILKK